jgi:hypothetical protein
MRRLLFLSRVALICNVFFLLAVSLQLANWLHNTDLVALIVMLGYLMVAIVNPLVNLLILLLLLIRRRLPLIPTWLIIVNFLFLVLQILYVLFLNDVQHKIRL